MSTEKIFPVDYSEIETKLYIQELTNKLDNSALPQGEKHNLESKIMLCQNHLMSLSIIESNNKLNESNENLKNNQTTLSKIWTDFISAEKKSKQTSENYYWAYFINISCHNDCRGLPHKRRK